VKTIQVTIDNMLLQRVDAASRIGGLSCSAIIRKVLELALREYKVTELEQRQINGFKRQPVTMSEFDAWEAEQI
jgi:metal-responsive CopG/Arc/MetJ family transcriptional regulator